MKKKIKYIKQGYSYIECTEEECYNWGGTCTCDFCGEKMTGTIYLIAILKQAMCEKCFRQWQERAKVFKEDLSIQDLTHKNFYSAYGFEVEE